MTFLKKFTAVLVVFTIDYRTNLSETLENVSGSLGYHSVSYVIIPLSDFRLKISFEVLENAGNGNI